MKKIFITLLTLLVLTPVFAVNNITGKWSWANDGYEVWGNAGNSGQGSDFTATNSDCKWWGVTNAADLTNQLHNSSGEDYGDADNNAYMMFENGKVTTYKADGTVIRSGSYSFKLYSDGRNNNWELGKLTTSTPALLFPWSINEGGKSVTEFDVMYYDGVNMTLVYTKGNSASSWGEITYWRFRNGNDPIVVNGISYMQINDTELAVVASDAGYSGDFVIDPTVQVNGKTYNVTTIAATAFKDCTKLTSITLPSTITKINSDAFSGCTSLTKVNIMDMAAWYKIYFDDNPLKYAHNLYLNGEKVSELVIPNTITSILNKAFYGCTSITSVEIPNSVTSIGRYAFYGCTGLETIVIPTSVTTIENYAFYNCTGLTYASVPDNATKIGRSVFDGCTSLALPVYNSTYFIKMPTTYNGKYVISNSTKYILNNAFKDCTGITGVTIPNTVKEIGDYAFSGCTGLTKIDMPNSVAGIGSNAFENCTNLNSVTLSESLVSIPNYCFTNCKSLTLISIPNSVEYISNWAFCNCTSLESVSIGNGLYSWGCFDSAFENCTSLKTVTCRTVTPPTIRDAFLNVTLANATLIVPSEDYLTANVWKEFGTIKVEASDLTADITDEDYKIESESYKAGNITYSRDITDGTYITLCLPFSVDISAATGIEHVYLPSGFAVYNTATERVQLYVEELKSTIPGSTPVIIKTTGSDLYVANSSVAVIPLSLNQAYLDDIKVYDMNPNSSILMKNDDITMSWCGTYEPFTANDYIKSFNSDGSFGPHTGTLSPFRAYIYEVNNSSSAKVAGIDIMFGDESTAIKNLKKSEYSSNQKVYNLNGQQVGTMQPGKIYIVNGRKVIK